jgi:hypothetical protein
MIRDLALVLCLFACGCDPIWTVSVEVRDPADRPIPQATVALACAAGDENAPVTAVTRSDEAGASQLGGIGDRLPPECDLFVAKPGYRTERLPYRELCPGESDDCDRTIERPVVLRPE